MKKIYWLIGSALLSLSTGLAQENHFRNSQWYPYETQVEFARADPSPYWWSSPHASTNPFNGSVLASVCDQNGAPLIVVKTSGVIWAKGYDLGYMNSASTRNVIIVPKPNHPDRYYIVAANEGTGLNYAEVNLATSTFTTQAPLKDLSEASVLSSPGGSGIASTVHANGTDYWITAFANDTLMSYLVTANGISTTPSGGYSLPPSDPDSTLKIKISPQTSSNEKHIAIANLYTGVSLKNFNDVTGEITENYSNINSSLQLKGLQNLYDGIYTKDVEFSSDGSTLYCADYGSTYGIQESSTNITPIDEFGTFIALQRGPDGNVYFIDGQGYLNRSDPWSNPYAYPYRIDIRLFNYSSWQQWASLLPQLVSTNQCLALTGPLTFNDFASISNNTPGSVLPMPNEGITGTWNPPTFVEGEHTYTFTAGCGTVASKTFVLLKQKCNSSTGKKAQSPKETKKKEQTNIVVVYPNPSNGLFNIDLSKAKDDYTTVRVYNMLGAIVYEGNLTSKSSNQIDLNNMSTGLYIAKVSGNSGSSSFQLIKQ